MPRLLRRMAGLAILGGLAAALAKRAGRVPQVEAGEAVTSPPGPAPESSAPGIRATPPVEAPGPSVPGPEDPAASIAAAAASVAEASAAKRAKAGAQAARAAAADAKAATDPETARAAAERARAAATDALAAAAAMRAANDPDATVEFDLGVLGPDPDEIDRRTSIESRLAAEEAAAAAEAAAIGGPHPRGEPSDPALRAVYEAGGGEAEGFEQAEEALIRNATHDDGGGKPLRDAFRPEAEADRSNAVYAEADRVESTEVVESDEESTGPGRPSGA